MSSASERSRNNVRVGIFVTVVMMLFLFVLVALTDIASSLNKSTEQYVVRFNVLSGVSNLKSGADVRVGGLSMGKVVAVEPVLDDQPFETIEVRIEIESRVTLYDNAVIVLSSSLLGAESWLDCPSVGNPTDGETVAPGGMIIATDSMGMLTTLLGSGNAAKAGTIMDDFQQTARSARSFVKTIDEKAGPVMENLQTISTDTRELLSQVKDENWANWSGSVDRLFTWAVGATGSFDETIEEGRLLMTDLRGVVDENRSDINQIVSNTESFSARLDAEIAEKAIAMLDRGQEGLDQAMAVMENLRDDYESWAVDIGESLGNASLASQQLKLAMIEIRRSPWKVLYKPTNKELQHELLYEATRSFAVAAADIKAASMSVKRIMENHGEMVAQDRELYDRITRSLLDPLDRYERAQQQLFDVLVMETK